MKKSILMVVMTIFSIGVFAQEKMISVPESQLTEQQKLQVAQQQTTQTLESASKWVGLGKEVGEAINSGLIALTHNADTLSRTNVGKFTMVMIAWKVMGTDLLQLAVGFILFIFIITFSMIYYFQNIRRRKLFDKSYDEEGKITEESVRFVDADSDDKWSWVIITLISLAFDMVVIFS
jgi:Flp pilus assembly protein TadB